MTSDFTSFSMAFHANQDIERLCAMDSLMVEKILPRVVLEAAVDRSVG